MSCWSMTSIVGEVRISTYARASDSVHCGDINNCLNTSVRFLCCCIINCCCFSSLTCFGSNWSMAQSLTKDSIFCFTTVVSHGPPFCITSLAQEYNTLFFFTVCLKFRSCNFLYVLTCRPCNIRATLGSL